MVFGIIRPYYNFGFQHVLNAWSYKHLISINVIVSTCDMNCLIIPMLVHWWCCGNPVRKYMSNVIVNGDTLPLSILVMNVLVISVVGIRTWMLEILSYQKLHRKGKSGTVWTIAALTFWINKQTKNINIYEKRSSIYVSSKFLCLSDSTLWGNSLFYRVTKSIQFRWVLWVKNLDEYWY